MAPLTPALALLACLAMLTPAAASPMEPLVRIPAMAASLALLESEEFLDSAKHYMESFTLDNIPVQVERTADFIEEMSDISGFSCVIGFSGQPLTELPLKLPGNYSIPSTFVDPQISQNIAIHVFGIGPIMNPANIPIPGIGYWKIASSTTGHSDCLVNTGLWLEADLPWISTS